MEDVKYFPTITREATNKGERMTDEEQIPSRGARILASIVILTICVAVVLGLLAVAVGRKYALRMFIGVMIIGIPGEVIVEFFGGGGAGVRSGGKPARSRGTRLFISALVLVAWALAVFVLTTLVKPWRGASGDMAWMMALGILVVLVGEFMDTRRKK